MAAKGGSVRDSILNFNVGVLGHIDSGKTALAKALSTVASTASFDKNPQSKERGITLDLGFSSFTVPFPAHLSKSDSSANPESGSNSDESGSSVCGSRYESVQFTLVDCPGHASLIRTIIGGAQIIDLMMLVVDITKGMQTQTAECLVIGEITCEHMIVVLNKIDLVEESKREAQIVKMTKKMIRTLETTRFAGCPVVAVAAKPGGPEAPPTECALGVDKLIAVLIDQLFIPKRSPEGPFVFSVDHCFPIRGQGTVMTGTVLNGSVAISDSIEIPTLKVIKKVKSMQMFHEPVSRATQGDRVGICVTQFDPKQVERCLVCSPGHLPTLYAGIISVHKIPYHKSPCTTGAKFHVTIGHETLMAKATFFGSDCQSPAFDIANEYHYLEHMTDTRAMKTPTAVATDDDVIAKSTNQFALLEFEKPVTCPAHSVVIGSRLDVDAYSNTCRIAFHGELVQAVLERDYISSVLPRLKIYKMKSREGTVERLQDERTVIGKSLFKKETKIELFVGLKVKLSTGEVGTIEGTFGTSGKFRVSIPDGLSSETVRILSVSKKKGKGKSNELTGGGTAGLTGGEVEASQTSGTIKIYLNFKRYLFDPKKQMIQ